MKTGSITIGILALLAAVILYQGYRIAKLQETIVAVQIRETERMIATFDSLASRRVDTVRIIERTIGSLETNRRNHETVVQNTRDADSLVVLYFRHRANLDD